MGAFLAGLWRGARKVPLVIWVAGALLAGGWTLWSKYQDAQQARVIAELELVKQKDLNDSTVARLAAEIVVKDSVGALLDAAKKLNGRLESALRIRVPARDTVIVHGDSTVLGADSTRTLAFHDSTFAGTIEGTVTAPPCCAALGITYRVYRPTFAPQVGFVRVGNRTVAVVSWAGEQVTIEAPFARTDRRLGTLGGYVEGLYGITGPSVVRVGGVVRGPWHVTLVTALEQRVEQGASPAAYIGLRKDW